ncbi:hypothetical protein M3Y99_01389100 [Aphelenchoides fujianensis]|nr:hypothetical protein M3Y99_01389100 [Aphelenchoides fujianensis]
MSRSRLPLVVQRAAGLQVERRVHFGIPLLRSVFAISGRVIGVLGLLFVLHVAVDWRAGGWTRGTNGSVQPAALLSGSPVPAECFCEDENFCFKGLDERGAVRWGRRFDCGLLGALRAARLTDAAAARTPPAAERMAADERWTPVFVSAVSSNHFREARNLAGELPPFSTHTTAVHSVFATTHPSMAAFLPLPLVVGQMAELQSTFQFVANASYTRRLLKWWLLCAWTRECVAPPGAAVRCRLADFHDLRRTWIGCHRFDQASKRLAFWNIAALAQLFGEERGAVHLGYADDWAALSEDLVAQVERRRLDALQKFFKLVNIRREDRMDAVLRLNCSK